MNSLVASWCWHGGSLWDLKVTPSWFQEKSNPFIPRMALAGRGGLERTSQGLNCHVRKQLSCSLPLAFPLGTWNKAKDMKACKGHVTCLDLERPPSEDNRKCSQSHCCFTVWVIYLLLEMCDRTTPLLACSNRSQEHWVRATYSQQLCPWVLLSRE